MKKCKIPEKSCKTTKNSEFSILVKVSLLISHFLPRNLKSIIPMITAKMKSNFKKNKTLKSNTKTIGYHLALI